MNTSEQDPLTLLQAQTLQILRQFLRPGSTVALLDFPRHHNAGDSLIWVGTLAYLKQLGIKVGYVASVHHLDPELLRRRVPEGQVLIIGGGNLGSRWIEHQRFRERILEEFSDREVVQLPQSPEFSDEDDLNRIASTLDAHPNLTLLIRERQAAISLVSRLRRTRVAFCPDLAFGYGRPKSTNSPRVSVVALFRTDSEAVGLPYHNESDEVTLTDWQLAGRFAGFYWWILRSPENLVRLLPFLNRYLHPMVALSFYRMSNYNVKSAITTLEQGRCVATDRLHAMVLATLLGRPVMAVDNANHKVANIFHDYVREFPDVMLVEDREQAIGSAMVYANSQEGMSS